MKNIACTVVRIVVLAVGLSLAFTAAGRDSKTPKPPPPPTTDGIKKEMSDLEEAVGLWEKQLEGATAKARASAYQQLLFRADRLGAQIYQLQQLLQQAMASSPKNDPNGGLTKTVTGLQQVQLNELSDLEARLKAVKVRIDALGHPGDGDKAGAAGDGKGGKTTLTPSAGDRPK